MKTLMAVLTLSAALWAQDAPRAVAIVVHADRPAFAAMTPKPEFAPSVLVKFEATVKGSKVEITAYAGDEVLGATTVDTTTCCGPLTIPSWQTAQFHLAPGKLPDRIELRVWVVQTTAEAVIDQ